MTRTRGGEHGGRTSVFSGCEPRRVSRCVCERRHIDMGRLLRRRRRWQLQASDSVVDAGMARGRRCARETAREQSRRYFLFAGRIPTACCRDVGAPATDLAQRNERSSAPAGREQTQLWLTARGSRNRRSAFRQRWSGDGQRATAVEENTNGRARPHVRRRLRRVRRHAFDDGRGRRAAATRRLRRSSRAAMDRASRDREDLCACHGLSRTTYAASRNARRNDRAPDRRRRETRRRMDGDEAREETLERGVVRGIDGEANKRDAGSFVVVS